VTVARYGGEGNWPAGEHTCTLGCDLLGCSAVRSHPRPEDSDAWQQSPTRGTLRLLNLVDCVSLSDLLDLLRRP
jgi:hypothetical protein